LPGEPGAASVVCATAGASPSRSGSTDQRRSRNKHAIDVAANAEREGQIARRLAGADGLAVLILGGGHDLAAALKRQAANLRYLRVATKAYQEAAGE
jgi:hypothetical protein